MMSHGILLGQPQISANTWTRLFYFTGGYINLTLNGRAVNIAGLAKLSIFWPTLSQVNRSGLCYSSSMMKTNANILTIYNITDQVFELWIKVGNPGQIEIYKDYESIASGVNIDGITTSATEPTADNVTYKEKVTIQ
jgi:hypothetical protein